MLKINPKFAAIAPPLKECEYRILEEDIKVRGCVDPVLAWNGTIIDGHNRYRICMENDIPFSVQDISFASENEACCFIVKNQLGRRNLTPFQKCELVIPFEAALMEDARKRRSGKYKSVYRGQTRDILADMAGVSHDTVSRSKKISAIGDEETKRRLRCGEISINRAYTELTMKAKPAVEAALPAVEVTLPAGKDPGSCGLAEIDYELDALIHALTVKRLDKDFIIHKLSEISGLVKKERWQ